MVNLTQFPTEVIGIIMLFLSAYEIVNLYLSGSSNMRWKLITQKYASEFVMSHWKDLKVILKDRQSKMFKRDPKFMEKAQNMIARIGFEWKYLNFWPRKEVLFAIGPICTLRIPHMVFQLPHLTTFILEMPQMVLLGYFNINTDLLQRLPPSLTRLELNGQIDLRLNNRNSTFFNFGAQFPQLKTLKLKRYHDKLVFISPTNYVWSRIASTLPSTLQNLGLSSIPETKGMLLDNLRQLSSFELFGKEQTIDISNFSPDTLTDISVPQFTGSPSLSTFRCLTSISVHAFHLIYVESLPLSLTSLSIRYFRIVPAWADHILNMQWSRFIPQLPSTLRSLSLSALTYPEFSFHPKCSLKRPYERGVDPDEISLYQKKIFPKALTSLKMNFDGVIKEWHNGLSRVADRCCISEIIPTSIILFEFKKPMTTRMQRQRLPVQFKRSRISSRHFEGDYWTKLKKIISASVLDIRDSPSLQPSLLPSQLTFLSFKAIVPFEEGVWTQLKNLTYLSVYNGWGVPESLLYSPNLPKNLTVFRVYLLTVDGTSWKYISQKAHLPHYSSFINSFTKANKSSYRAATLFETRTKTCCFEIANFDYSAEMHALPPASTSQGRIRLSKNFMTRLDVPPALSVLNVKGHEISSKFLSLLPNTVESVVNATFQLSPGELDDLAGRYFHQWHSIEIPGSFSRALQSEFTKLKNPKVLVSVPLSGRSISKWLHAGVKKLTLKSEGIVEIDALFNTHVLESLIEWNVAGLLVIENCDTFRGAPNLQKLSCPLSLDSISLLPRNLADLSIFSIRDEDHSRDTSPNWPFALTSLRVQNYPNFLAHLSPGSMPHLKTLIIGTKVSIQDEMISHIPRSVTQLFIKAMSPLTTGCIQHLPMNLEHLKIYGGHLKSERILLEQKEFRSAQTKQSE